MRLEAPVHLAGKHLVIFGCGYIGGEVARQAITAGMRVTALTRNQGRAAELKSAGVAAVVADLSSADWHVPVGSADLALNCVSSGGGGAEAYRRSYLAGMQSVLEWCRRVGPLETFVYTSSTSVYASDGGARIDETAEAKGRDERSQILVETEALLGAAAQAARRRVVLRLAGIYGPGRTHLLGQVRAGEVSGNPGHYLNLIHRDDVCAAIWAAFGSGESLAEDVFNVVDDGAATRGEIVAWLAGQLGRPVPRFTGTPAGGRAPTPDRIIGNARLKAKLAWHPLWPTFREGYANLLSR